MIIKGNENAWEYLFGEEPHYRTFSRRIINSNLKWFWKKKYREFEEWKSPVHLDLEYKGMSGNEVGKICSLVKIELSNQQKKRVLWIMPPLTFLLFQVCNKKLLVWSACPTQNIGKIFVTFVFRKFSQPLSRSRHRTTNFPNSEYFVCLLFYYFFCETHFFEARLERVIDGAADCWSYFWSSKK